jgi:cell division protein FtsL
MIGVDDKVTKLEKEVNEPNAKKEDYSNPIDILKRRLQKIVETNKEKRKLMDQYLRNVKVIEDSFD